MLQWKIFMIMALVGHVFCGISDCLLTYAPNGKVDLASFKDYKKTSTAFKGMPLKNLSFAMALGVVAMTLEIFGYLALCDWMRQFSETYYMIMFVATLVMFINLALHHQFSDSSCDWNNITSSLGMYFQSAATGNCHYANETAGKSKCYRSCYVCRLIVPDMN